MPGHVDRRASVRGRCAAAAVAVLALVCLLLGGAATADAAAPVVPVLTGGQLSWSGNATRHVVGHAVEAPEEFDVDTTSTLGWDTRYLLDFHYPEGPSGPVVRTLRPTRVRTPVTGSGSGHWWGVQCEGFNTCDPQPFDHSCSWQESSHGAQAVVADLSGRHLILLPDASGTTPTASTCAGLQYPLPAEDLWDTACSGADHGLCHWQLQLPDALLEGAAATIARSYALPTAPDIDECTSELGATCAQSGTASWKLACALCVTAIRFEQADLPGRGWTAVPADGTFDGNTVRVTATIHNATDDPISAPVRFLDQTVHRDLPVASDGKRPPATVSVAAGADVEVTLDWDTEGFAWYAPGRADPHRIYVTTPYGGARSELAVRPKPVLLVHGWNSDASTWAGYPDFFTGVRGDWVARAVTGMNTDPNAGNTLAANAAILGRAVARLREELGAEHVDLVGHSMGGLISRLYLASDMPSDPDGRPVVAHLVMLGTPNEGSTCADLMVAAGVQGMPTWQLTPEYLLAFNFAVRDTKGTRLSVLAGIANRVSQATSGFVCDLGKPNDLVVWRQSAFWTIADRAQQSGLDHLSMTHDRTAFATFVKPHLAVTPAAAASASRRARAAARARPATAATSRETGAAPGDRAGPAAAHAAARSAAAATVSPSVADAGTQAIRPRRARVRRLQVRGGRRVGVALLAPAGVRATLRDPRGHRVAAATSGGGLTVLAAAVRRRGRWKLTLVNPTRRRVRVTSALVIDHDPDRAAAIVKAARRGRLRITIRAAGARGVRATLLSGGRRHGAVRFVRTAPGRFVAKLRAPARAATIAATVRRRAAGRSRRLAIALPARR